MSLFYESLGYHTFTLSDWRYDVSTNLLTWSRVLLEKLTCSQLAKEWLTFYGIRRFITAFTRAHDLFVCCRDLSSQCPSSNFLKMHFSIIFPPMPRSSKWLLSLRFLHQNSACTTTLPYTCYMPHPSNASWFNHRNYMWWGVQIMKLHVM